MIIVKVPLESGLDSLGCKNAGNEMISHLPISFTNEGGRELLKSDLRLEEIHIDNSKQSQAHELIYKNSIEIIESNEKTIFLGGDHGVSYSIAKAFVSVCKSEKDSPFLIVFDAHADCKESGEMNYIWIRELIKEGFPRENIILVGLRIYAKQERMFLEENKIRIYSMKDLNDFEEICDIIMEIARKNQIYLSIDIDVVDASFVPGTAHPESAGLTTRQLIYFIQRINLLKNLRVVDIVEINPKKDVNLQTVKLGTKILQELL